MVAPRNQRGIVLVTSLLLLTVMTTLVVSSLNMGTTNLRILDNMRIEREAQAVAQVAIADFLSTKEYFKSPQGSTYTRDGHSIEITAPVCVAAREAESYTKRWPLTPEDTTWRFTATVDHAEGATVVIEQGVEIRMRAGSCTGAA